MDSNALEKQVNTLTEQVQRLEKEAADNRQRMKLISEAMLFAGNYQNDAKAVQVAFKEYGSNLLRSIPKG